MTDEHTAPMTLTGEQMLEIRSRALGFATAAIKNEQQPAQVLHTAGIYLGFLLNGQPVFTVPDAVVTSASVPPKIGRPPKNAAKAEAAAQAAPVAAQAAPAVATAPPAAAPVSAAAPAPAATATPAKQPELQPPPVTVTDAALALKALVQGRGRDVGVGLLQEYGVAQMSQIPPAKLADFVAKAKALLIAPTQKAEADPMSGLV
jgi:hypothetical protein